MLKAKPAGARAERRLSEPDVSLGWFGQAKASILRWYRKIFSGETGCN